MSSSLVSRVSYKIRANWKALLSNRFGNAVMRVKRHRYTDFTNTLVVIFKVGLKLRPRFVRADAISDLVKESAVSVLSDKSLSGQERAREYNRRKAQENAEKRAQEFPKSAKELFILRMRSVSGRFKFMNRPKYKAYSGYAECKSYFANQHNLVDLEQWSDWFQGLDVYPPYKIEFALDDPKILRQLKKPVIEFFRNQLVLFKAWLMDLSEQDFFAYEMSGDESVLVW